MRDAEFTVDEYVALGCSATCRIRHEYWSFDSARVERAGYEPLRAARTVENTRGRLFLAVGIAPRGLCGHIIVRGGALVLVRQALDVRWAPTTRYYSGDFKLRTRTRVVSRCELVATCPDARCLVRVQNSQ